MSQAVGGTAAVVLGAMLDAAGCSDDNGSRTATVTSPTPHPHVWHVTITAVRVSGPTEITTPGGTASSRDGDALDRRTEDRTSSATWTSENVTVATVASNGMVRPWLTTGCRSCSESPAATSRIWSAAHWGHVGCLDVPCDEQGGNAPLLPMRRIGPGTHADVAGHRGSNAIRVGIALAGPRRSATRHTLANGLTLQRVLTVTERHSLSEIRGANLRRSPCERRPSSLRSSDVAWRDSTSHA